MWREQPFDRAPLLIQVMRHSELVYGFNALHRERGLVREDVRIQLPPQENASLRQTLRELTNPAARSRPDLFQKLGFLLFKLVLPESIQDLLETHDGPLVFAADELSLPWELLHDGTEFLALKKPFSRRLKDSEVLADLGVMSLFPQTRSGDEPALIIADTQGNLDSAAEEAEEVRSLLESRGVRCETLIGPKDCTVVSILGHLSEKPYQIIHYCGHAEEVPLKDDMTSAIPLANDLLMAESIRKVLVGEPIVFLNACYSHSLRADPTRTADRDSYVGAEIVRSLTQAFTVGSKKGRAKAVIGTMWWIDDTLARGLSSRLYRGVFDGLTLGEAMRQSRQETANHKADPRDWSPYVLFGSSELTWVTQDKQSPSPQVADSGSVAMGTGPTGPVSASPKSKASQSDAGQMSEQLCDAHPQTASAQPQKLPTDVCDEDIPWADEVRVTLMGAIAAMSKMKWSIFSTVHLLMGLTYLEQGYLTGALRAQRLDPDSFRRQLRQLLAQQQRTSSSDFTVSDNVKVVFRGAKQLARERGDSEVSERHLLASFLSTTQSSATQILAALGIDLARLAQDIRIPTQPTPALPTMREVPTPNVTTGHDEREMSNQRLVISQSVVVPIPFLREPVTTVEYKRSTTPHEWQSSSRPIPKNSDVVLPDGNLDRRLFDESCLKALDAATVLAWKTNWPDIRSPHLFLGILTREQSQLADHLRVRTRLSPTSLANLLVQGLNGPINISRPVPKLHQKLLSENALEVLRSSQRRAVQRDAAGITECDLLEAILADESNIITRTLIQAEIEPRSLLWDLSHWTTSVMGLIRRDEANHPMWLAAWRAETACYEPPVALKRADESQRQAVLRELNTRFNFDEVECAVVPSTAAQQIAWLATIEEQDYETRCAVFLITLTSPAMLRLLDADPDIRWLSADEIRDGHASDGRLIGKDLSRAISKVCSPSQ